MRNGLDISGVSEFIDEIKNKPEEAIIRFRTLSHLDRGLTEVRVRTGSLGTIRMARGHRVPLRTFGNDERMEMTPYEAAICALAACVTITNIQGSSARGISFNSFSLRVTSELDIDADGRWAGGETSYRNLRFDLDSHSDGGPEQTAQIAQFGSCFSPNHRAFVDEADYQVTGRVRRSDGTVEEFDLEWEELIAPRQGAGPKADTLTIQADQRWEYGLETSGVTTQTPGPDRWSERLPVDQPKQMFGIDSGPNPQELLLTAVCGELAPAIEAEARAGSVDLDRVEVECNGMLDIRGMQNVRKESLARFHGLEFRFHLDSDAPLADLRAAALEAARGSATLATLRAANHIDFHVSYEGEPVMRFESCGPQVAEFLKVIEEMAAQAAAQAAQAAEEAEAPALAGADQGEG